MVQKYPKSKDQTACRICGSNQLTTYLDLGRTPLANSYLKKKDLAKEEFKEELVIQLCSVCGLSQLTKVVHPDLMFKNYLYVSSTPITFRDHCTQLAKDVSKLANTKNGDLVLDIASNDGLLLTKFHKLGLRIVGVDPAENLAKEANMNGVPTICDYWSTAIAKNIIKKYGRPKIVTAQNVFAHVDDHRGFVKAIELCLAEKGVFIIECPYLLDFIEKNEFDTAYHEHLAYIGITPLSYLMKLHGFEIFKVSYFANIHGGTIRVYISRKGDFPIDSSVNDYLEREEMFGIRRLQVYNEFAKRIRKNKGSLMQLLNKLRDNGELIWAYGASAKGNTLVNYFGITDKLIPVVVDDNPKKRGYFTPGAHMKIVGTKEVGNPKVDYMLLLAWNFKNEIMKRAKEFGYKGKFIIPVPRPEIVN